MATPRRAARLNTSAPSASTTVTLPLSETFSGPSTRIHIPSSGTLRLRAEAGPSQQPPLEPERRIHWAQDVVNNEGMGKKSSKVCCIYHKPRAVDESSSDESSSGSSSDDDSDIGNDDASARPAGGSRRQHDDGHGHGHAHDAGKCDHGGSGRTGTGKGKARKKTTNAYEQVPKND